MDLSKSPLEPELKHFVCYWSIATGFRPFCSALEYDNHDNSKDKITAKVWNTCVNSDSCVNGIFNKTDGSLFEFIF